MREEFKNLNIYEVNIRQYTSEGTFNAFREHLPRLRDMGVKILWLMPITPISQIKMKGSMGSPYAPGDFTAVNPEFGTLQDFKDLVTAAHNEGMLLIIDWIANHTGWGHRWVEEFPEYYKKDEDSNFKTASGMVDIIELDYTNSEMRQSMLEAMEFWVKETNIDGFRCDLASWVPLDFWREAKFRLDAIKPLFWLGEYEELDHPNYGTVFDAAYTWKWMHLTREYCEGRASMDELRNLLRDYSCLGDCSMRTWFTTNHDENSWNGTEYEKYGTAALPLAVFSATWNGIPLIYSGQEIPNLERLKFFDKDALEWPEKLDLENFYRKLLQLKFDNPALLGASTQTGTYLLNTTHNDKVLAYLRKSGNVEVLVLLNFSRGPVEVELFDNLITGRFREIFDDSVISVMGNLSVLLGVSGFKVYVKI